MFIRGILKSAHYLKKVFYFYFPIIVQRCRSCLTSRLPLCLCQKKTLRHHISSIRPNTPEKSIAAYRFMFSTGFTKREVEGPSSLFFTCTVSFFFVTVWGPFKKFKMLYSTRRQNKKTQPCSQGSCSIQSENFPKAVLCLWKNTHIWQAIVFFCLFHCNIYTVYMVHT